MNVLALTHAHLTPDGLSPVSCERADSIVGTWGSRFKWNVDVVYTAGTRWRGIWPEGKGLPINIVKEEAPRELMMAGAKLFSTQVRDIINKRQFLKLVPLVTDRMMHRARTALANKGWVATQELNAGEQWGQYLAGRERIRKQRYDFLFVCVGYGDEYLLQTALTLSKRLGVPMVVDFRDLWSDHHDPDRFNEQQKQLIRQWEKKLLTRTVLISVPHRHMGVLLNKWSPIPVHLLSHSAYVGADWEDGQATNDEFRMVYAGKLYATGPGIGMLMEFIKKLLAEQLYKPLRCEFYVDDTETLKRMAESYGISAAIAINGWVSPGELWKKLRSAHLLLLPDAGVAENYPLLPTKIFQYAYTGRQILCLEKYPNYEIKEFLDKHAAGIATTDTDVAVKWVKELSAERGQYGPLPPLRDIRLREDQAVIFGLEIEKIIAKKNNFTANE